MITRIALLGCLCVAGPALAGSAESVPKADAGTGRVAPGRHPAMRVGVLPPIRPDLPPDEATDIATAPADAAVPDLPAPGPVVTVLPPLRPSYPDDATEESLATSDVAHATRPVAVAALPPERPLFGDEAAPGSVPAIDDGAPSGAIVVLTPPARPAFRWDGREAAGAVSVEEDTSSSGIAVTLLPPARPAFAWDPEPVATGALPDAAPASPSLFGTLFAPLSAPAAAVFGGIASGHAAIDALIATHARLNDVPEALVHRVVIRESKYNPRAVGRGGALGLMQIKQATARALGYGGTAAGLLDAETNITYAVKYLAGAYRAAGGSFDGAVRNYARGYYYEAKRLGLIKLAEHRGRRERLRQEADASATFDPATSAPPVVSDAGAR